MGRSDQPLYLLQVLAGTAVSRLRFSLTAGMFVVGSQPDCDVCLPAQGVSRRHASLEVLPDGGVVVVDLGSRNGTVVAERRIQRAVVSADTLVRFGPVEAQLVPLSGPLVHDRDVDRRIEPIPCGARQWESDASSPILEVARRHGELIAA